MPEPICPFARQRLLARAAAKPTIAPTATGAHSAVSAATGQELGDFFEHAEVDSHFYIDRDGTLWQYLPVDRKSWAQYTGNDHVVSYETWDGGNPATPWNPAQLDTITRLLAWLYRTWNISLDVSTTSTGPGAGWHSKYPQWNTDAHNCPGSTRVGQLVQEVLPAAHRLVDLPAPTPPQEENMALTPPIEIDIDHATGRGFAVVPGVKVNDVRGFVPRVEHAGAMKGVVPEFGLEWEGAVDGDAVVWGQLPTPPVVNVKVHVQIAHA